MSGPSVYFSWPTALQLIPDNLPPALPPPVKERTFRSPFGIEKQLFNFALRPEIPILFAATYITVVFSLNAYNRSQEHKPWWISKQKAFHYFVVLHNVLLALYSIATFAAMWRAIRHTWPGFNNANGAAGIADALCKINGPRGLGDAATYNTTINIWEAKNMAIHLGYDGNPDPTDVGRLWNEGLAFWGWIFYMSKFYEVIDTLIILAKGKRSATLQTYHHAGAMLCMWAGIRYMSPPIWMFVFINSFIHGMMYTYFTLSALGYRVPQSLKRTLTSLQIAQFIFGASYAAVHLFIQYDIPVNTSYQVASTVQRVVSSASSAVSSVASEVSKVAASPTATATLGALLKKLLLRAAGEEGVAERIHDERTGELTTPHMEEKIQHFNEQTWETKWRTDWTKVNCIDTSGQAFAIYLNLLYLAPLTFLFARFFFKAYTQRGKARTARQAAKKIASSEREAERRTSDVYEDAGKRIEDALRKHGPEAAEKVRQEGNDLHDQLREDVRRMKEGKFRGDRRVSDRVASFERQVKTSAQKAVEKGRDMVSGNGSPRRGNSPSKKDFERPQVKEEDESAIEDEPKKESEQDVKDVEESKPQPESSDPQPSATSKSQDDGPSKPQDDDQSDSQRNEEAKAEPMEEEEKPPLGSGTHNESEQKQEENMADSQATREGTAEGQDAGDDQNVDTEDKENQAPDDTGAGTNNEPEAKQDENIADSQALRPGAGEEKPVDEVQGGDEEKGGDDDSDAMGKSGSIIDLAKENAKDAPKETEAENAAAGAESEDAQSSPLGADAS